MDDPKSADDTKAASPSLADKERAVRQRSWQPAFMGAAAGVAASLAVRFVLGQPTPAEIFGDRLTVLIPLPMFSRLLDLFGSNAKHVFFFVTLLGHVVALALLAACYMAVRHRKGPSGLTPADGALLSVVPWIISAGVLAPVIGGGLFGAQLTGGVGGVFLSDLIPDVIFATTLVALAARRRAFTPDVAASLANGATGAAIGRRRLLRDVGFVVAVVAGGALAWDVVSGGVSRLLGLGGANQPDVNLGDVPARVPPPTPTYTAFAPAGGQTAEITTADRFYYVSKNLAADPNIDAVTWQLSIDGAVDAPYSLTYDALRSLPTVERFHTLECISNEVGGDLMSNARFTGASLADLLNRARIQTGAAELIFRAADGYSDSLHLAQALDPRSLVVYLINGQPLPTAHGFPARLLIPGLYGMKNGKWLTSLTISRGSYSGYWEDRGWTREALIKPTARIDVPHEGDLLPARTLTIAGVAYAGDRGIGRVDVSTDGGETYHPATFHPAALRQPLGPLTWVLWQFTWVPPAPGRYVLMARCIDLQGNVQTPAEAPPLPDGASGYHRIAVVIG